MDMVEVSRWNLRKKVMDQVVGIVAREEEQANQCWRKDISRSLKFILRTDQSCMVQTIRPKVQRGVNVKQWDDNKEKRCKRGEDTERSNLCEKNNFEKDEGPAVIAGEVDASVGSQVLPRQRSGNVSEDAAGI